MDWKEKVRELINEIKPALQADGGDVEIVDITDDGIVKVRLVGVCGTCPFSMITLKQGIERFIKSRVSEVEKVEAV
ncbi:MAG: NifU family protein [Thermosulfidibacteraceae bacterium]|jgi:Fe-S cluster biogenesis protein NfuA